MVGWLANRVELLCVKIRSSTFPDICVVAVTCSDKHNSLQISLNLLWGYDEVLKGKLKSPIIIRKGLMYKILYGCYLEVYI